MLIICEIWSKQNKSFTRTQYGLEYLPLLIAYNSYSNYRKRLIKTTCSNTHVIVNRHYIIYLAYAIIILISSAQYYNLIVNIPIKKLTYKMNVHRGVLSIISKRYPPSCINKRNIILERDVLTGYSMGSNTSKSCQFVHPPWSRTIVHKSTNITIYYCIP